jgi:hypothetical protein
MPLSALASTTASSKKAGFAKAVDAMGANLVFLIGCRCRNFAYDRLAFNGLLFIWGAFKK